MSGHIIKTFKLIHISLTKRVILTNHVHRFVSLVEKLLSMYIDSCRVIMEVNYGIHLLLFKHLYQLDLPKNMVQFSEKHICT